MHKVKSNLGIKSWTPAPKELNLSVPNTYQEGNSKTSTPVG
jgi:hypothetical protein